MTAPAWDTPLTLGPVVLPNRIVSTSHQTGLVEAHLPTEDLVAYHAARARGGVGAIVLEATAVHPTGLLTTHTLDGCDPAIVPAFRRLADAVHPFGTPLFVQLFHGGREQFSAAPRPPLVAPSAVPSARFKSEPRELSTAELEEILAGYATAARNARDGGLDGIEVSMSHGYLAAQFLDRSANRRDDAYNGSLEARLRFPREILSAVREAAGDGMAVGLRLTADEMGPDLMGAAACAEIAGLLCAGGGVDFCSFVLGHSASYASSTWIAPPAPVAATALTDALRVAAAAVTPVPVIASTRVVELQDAERLLGQGLADAVGMTRALIADPELLVKSAAGREDVVECIGCNQACIGHYHAGVPIGCTVNARTGRERSFPAARGGVRARRVVVVGAGPAGASAALEAAAGGAAVQLFEREHDVGGQLRLAGRAPAHRETWARYRRSTLRRLAAAGVHVRLGEEASAAVVDACDLAVIATGARPFAPVLPADPRLTVVQAWKAIERPGSVAGPVLVADWGGEWAGLDAAEVLAATGVGVTLACAATVPGEALHQYQRNLYLGRLDDLGVTVLHHAELTTDAGRLVLRHVFSGRIQPLPPVRTLVLAQGRVPDDALWRTVSGRPHCVRAGDVLGPRTAEEAVLEGARALHNGARTGPA